MYTPDFKESIEEFQAHANKINGIDRELGPNSLSSTVNYIAAPLLMAMGYPIFDPNVVTWGESVLAARLGGPTLVAVQAVKNLRTSSRVWSRNADSKFYIVTDGVILLAFASYDVEVPSREGKKRRAMVKLGEVDLRRELEPDQLELLWTLSAYAVDLSKSLEYIVEKASKTIMEQVIRREASCALVALVTEKLGGEDMDMNWVFGCAEKLCKECQQEEPKKVAKNTVSNPSELKPSELKPSEAYLLKLDCSREHEHAWSSKRLVALRVGGERYALGNVRRLIVTSVNLAIKKYGKSLTEIDETFPWLSINSPQTQNIKYVESLQCSMRVYLSTVDGLRRCANLLYWAGAEPTDIVVEFRDCKP